MRCMNAKSHCVQRSTVLPVSQGLDGARPAGHAGAIPVTDSRVTASQHDRRARKSVGCMLAYCVHGLLDAVGVEQET